MFDQIVGMLQENPYLGAAIVFLLCGMGLPLPEELVLLAAGYLCAKFPDTISLPVMMAWCAGAILVGDLLPFVAGRVFGVRLLRLRWMRLVVTKQRLANFDRWFRKRGDLVILIARFLAGLRMVAFFTAGTMKMPWRRFLLLDGLGIALIVPSLTWLGYHSAGFIESVVATAQKVERGILWGSLAAAALVGIWYWLWRRRQNLRRQGKPAETFVQPQLPIQEPVLGAAQPATETLEPAPEAGPEATDPPTTGDGTAAEGPASTPRD